MATWQDLANGSANAARQLVDQVSARSSISRAYYAVYAAITGRLVRQGLKEFGTFHNPAHDAVPQLIMKNFARIQPADRNELARIVRRLRLRREDADYRPGAFIDEGIRRNALRDMKTAGLLLGEEL